MDDDGSMGFKILSQVVKLIQLCSIELLTFGVKNIKYSL